MEPLGPFATASATVTAEPVQTYAAVLALAARLWGVTPAEIVHEAAPLAVVHAVTVDGQTACWLSWDLLAAGPGVTEVRVTHSEADLRSAPDPDLDAVLRALSAEVEGKPATTKLR